MGKKSDKELDLVELGLRDAYSGCYCFAFSFLCIVFGIALSCLSRYYENLTAFLCLLLCGLCLVLLSLALLAYGIRLVKKKSEASVNPVLHCPIQEKKILRNGYIVSSVLLSSGIGVLIAGSLFFPRLPIHGTVLYACSFVVLLYGSLLLISTIRDRLIVNASKQ